MKKICFVTTVFTTYKCFLLNFSEFLHKHNWDISLVCTPENDMELKLPDYVHYYPVEMKRGIDFSALSIIKQMNKIFREKEFDIIQYSTPNASLYASIASKKLPTVSLYCQWGIRYMGFAGWKRSIFKFLEKMTCKNSDYIEVESYNLRNFSLSEELYSDEKSCVVWNGSASGVDLTKFDVSKKDQWKNEIRSQYNIAETDIVFAFAARLTKDKGFNELLEAFLNLEKCNTDIRLLIMGDRDDTDPINLDLLTKAQASNNIIFTGNVPDVERYYAASDVFVSPSYREGFGLVVIEAQAMGVPAIVSNVPGQIDAIMEDITGLSCVVKDAQSLEAAMKKLIENSDLRKSLGKQAELFVKENFEQNELFKKLTSHRDELIGDK